MLAHRAANHQDHFDAGNLIGRKRPASVSILGGPLLAAPRYTRLPHFLSYRTALALVPDTLVCINRLYLGHVDSDAKRDALRLGL